MEFARAAALCNDAELRGAEDGWRVEGDPMEGALLALAGKITGKGTAPVPAWTRTNAIPFDAAHRYMAVLHHDHEGHTLIHVKGAPEAVLDMCANQRQSDGGKAPLDPETWHEAVEDLAAEGQRVIAVAVRAVDQDRTILNSSDLDGSLTLIGLIGLIDLKRSKLWRNAMRRGSV
ncbi:hypothetical protein [Breoghania sp.]|uniref:hypothetical protein n=1 Tax=Breoghania sp. TaxID=2065378 RepID=UPI002632DD88|nr:hypothetical protein [Breoghania sp.]MDJ0931257.1 hypothetical protein [Breoghania sp.]